MRKSQEEAALRGPTLVIDGKCNLCNSASGFIAARTSDERGQFVFLWAQHPDTIELLDREFKVSAEDIMQSWALIENGRIFRGSRAWLEATKYMTEPWRSLGRVVGLLVPEVLREAVYKVVARNRYRWFGGQETCVRPKTGLFLHDQ